MSPKKPRPKQEAIIINGVSYAVDSRKPVEGSKLSSHVYLKKDGGLYHTIESGVAHTYSPLSKVPPKL